MIISKYIDCEKYITMFHKEIYNMCFSISIYRD